MRVALREIAQQADPKRALLDRLGDLSGYEVFHNLVLFATYVPPEKIGSIIVPDKTLAESRFQGKVGLVLRCGPLAFQDDTVAKFGGVVIEPGDWIIYRPSDAIEHFVRDVRKTNEGISCRLIEDAHIKGRLADPSMIY